MGEIILFIIGLAGIVYALSSFNKRGKNGLFEKALVLGEKGNHAQAITLLNVYIRENPKNYKAYNNRGICKAGLGHYKEALSDFQASVNIEPNPITNIIAFQNIQLLNTADEDDDNSLMY